MASAYTDHVFKLKSGYSSQQWVFFSAVVFFTLTTNCQLRLVNSFIAGEQRVCKWPGETVGIPRRETGALKQAVRPAQSRLAQSIEGVRFQLSTFSEGSKLLVKKPIAASSRLQVRRLSHHSIGIYISGSSVCSH